MRIKPFTLAITVVVVMLAGIAASDMLGLWITTGSAEPTKITMSDNTVANNPADIKGSYTLKEVSSLYQVPLEDLLAAYGLTEDKADIKCKDLEKEFEAEEAEIGPPSIRLFVALYNQIPYATSDEFLPDKAVDILKQKNVLSDEQLKYLEEHTIILNTK